MSCPYCKRNSFTELVEQPYPFTRRDKYGRFLQGIRKLKCTNCNETFFEEIRLGTDMGGDNKIYLQVYKQGMKIYKDFSTYV